MKKKFYLSEKQLGYLMVLPALLLIAIVILWPIAQTFYNSLFDYKLNDPSRSDTYINQHIDLEKYIDSQFVLERSLNNLEETTDKELPFSKKINELHKDVQTHSGERYEVIESNVENFVNSSKDSRVIKIKKELANEFDNVMKETNSELEVLKEQNDISSSDYKAITGQLEALKSSVIKPNFIGFDHYAHYIKDGRMWNSVWFTVIFAAVTVFIELVIGLALALLLNRVFFGQGGVRVSVLIPWAIPGAVASIMWKYLLDGQEGFLSNLLEKIGLIEQAEWMLSTSTGAMISVMLTDIWKTTPYMALLLLAGLQTISKSLYEAADVDGAGRIDQFFKVTLPLLKSTMLVALLFRTLDAFRVFEVINVITGGGPANSTEAISIYAYKTMFSQQDFGAGSTLAIFVFLCIAVISFVYIKMLGSDLLSKDNK